MPIRVPTVLILGAGASRDFGFPLGVELRNQVLQSCQGEARNVLQDVGFSATEVDSFRSELRYSGERSVDAFLERNQDYLRVGKHAIAATLLPFETEQRLFPPGASHDNWYEFLANHMGVGSTTWTENKLSLVTFNYDRSFEHYFTKVIGQRLRVDRDTAFEKLSTAVTIVHVHGILGDYGSPTHLDYGAPASPAAVAAAADRILVVSEVQDTLATFDKAFDLLRGARRIYFLGFGFHPDNVRRLRFFDTVAPDLPIRSLSDVEDERAPLVHGTRNGFTQRQWTEVVTNVLKGHWSSHRDIADVSAFVRHDDCDFS